MKRCVIFCAGEIGPQAVARCAPGPEDFLIGADGGYRTAQALGFSPHLILGDFDSAPAPDDPAVLRFPAHKDDTDCLLAVREGLDRGYRDFVLLGAAGGRLDHTLANLQTLLFLKEHDADGVLLDERHTVRALRDEARTIPRFAGYLSVFALGGTCRVTLEGMEYPLQDHLLTPGYPLGVSNHIREATGTVTARDGALLLVCCREDAPETSVNEGGTTP